MYNTITVCAYSRYYVGYYLLQAAAVLQRVLDEEMGGWRNTFG